jgi:hypothetical protein
MKMPPQIFRLVLLTLGIIGSYLVARHFLTPPSFHQYGWYRGAALEEIASRTTPVYAGKKACGECHTHSDVLMKLGKGPHKTLSCEGCHGAGQAHADNPDAYKYKPDKRNTTSCTRCHESNPSRPAWLKQIVVKTHYSGKCTECHLPHQPNEVP